MIETRPNPIQWTVQAVQHVIILFSGIVLVPVILINFYNIPAQEGYRFIFMTGMCSAVATLMQVVRYRQFGLGAPMFMGTSGAFLACAHAAITQGGLPLLYNLVLITAPLFFLFGFGLRYIRHIITPTVGGVVIMLAMAGLLKDATHVWTGHLEMDGTEALVRILIGVITIGVMITAEWIGGKRYRPWSLVLGMTAGCIAAWLFGEVDLSRAGSAGLSTSWFGLPDRLFADIVFTPTPEHWMSVVTFGIAVMVTSIKYAGDVMALEQTRYPGRRTIDYDALKGGLYASGTSSIVAGLAGGLPATSHSPNIPLMGMTGIVSRRVAVAGAGLLAVIMLSPKITLLLICIPGPVVGAVGIVLVGHLFATGMRLAAGKELNFRNGFIAGISLCAGLAIESEHFFPNAFPDYLVPFFTNGFATGGVLAVLLTLLTRLQKGLGKVFRVPPSIDQLKTVHGNIAGYAQSFDLDEGATSALELACEEVFVHMVDESRKKNITRDIFFRLRNGAQAITVDVRCGTRVEDVSVEPNHNSLPRSIETLKEADLQSLGLMLLGHIARNIEHIHINQFAFISFEIPRQKSG